MPRALSVEPSRRAGGAMQGIAWPRGVFAAAPGRRQGRRRV